MFEESLVESTALLQTRNRLPALLSFAAQAVAALAIIAIPMLHPELLPMHAPAFALTPPPPHVPQPPPPVQRVHAALVSTGTPEAPSLPEARTSLIRTLLPTTDPAVDTPISTFGGDRMDATSSTVLNIGNTSGPATRVSVVPAAAPHVAPVKMSSGVTQGQLLAPMRPEYPAIAKASRQEGTVVVRAIISRSGAIERAEVLSGPAMLQRAALEAVERARYRPFLLNGQPTEVDTTVTITFRLGS